MSRGTLYGLGVGPGDPELLTLKAVRLLREADVVAVPDKGAGKKTALHIVRDYIADKPVLPCAAPMTRDQQALDAAHDAAAEQICALLDQGKTVVFVTLGDPAIYSTYMYIHRRVADRGYDAQLVPGVTSICAVAARLGDSLCEQSERLLIVPASHGDMSDCLDLDANLVFMKAGKELSDLRQQLAEHGLLNRASLVANCGMENETVWRRFEDMPDTTGYFSVVVVKKGSPET